MFNPHEKKIGGFSPVDGTIDFYLRIKSLIQNDSVVSDLGAGRAAWYEDDDNATRRDIRNLSNICTVIAADVDSAVLENRASEKRVIIEGGRIPVPSNSVDVVVADYVLEPIADPQLFKSEVQRVLKAGGSICARTPHKYHYVSVAARIVKNAKHSRILKKYNRIENLKMYTLFDLGHRLLPRCVTGNLFVFLSKPM